MCGAKGSFAGLTANVPEAGIDYQAGTFNPLRSFGKVKWTFFRKGKWTRSSLSGRRIANVPWPMDTALLLRGAPYGAEATPGTVWGGDNVFN